MWSLNTKVEGPTSDHLYQYPQGLFACSLIGGVPTVLYYLCISPQDSFTHDLAGILVDEQTLALAGKSTSVLKDCLAISVDVTFWLLNLLCLIAFTYCAIVYIYEYLEG